MVYVPVTRGWKLGWLIDEARDQVDHDHGNQKSKYLEWGVWEHRPETHPDPFVNRHKLPDVKCKLLNVSRSC